jgi:hypothetical protein
VIHTLSVVFRWPSAPASILSWPAAMAGFLPLLIAAMLHAAEQNSRGILTCWKMCIGVLPAG